MECASHDDRVVEADATGKPKLGKMNLDDAVRRTASLDNREGSG